MGTHSQPFSPAQVLFSIAAWRTISPVVGSHKPAVLTENAEGVDYEDVLDTIGVDRQRVLRSKFIWYNWNLCSVLIIHTSCATL